MRGYFAIGVEGVTKSMNVGALMRTAHAFGASFVFTLAANYERAEGRLADTSDTPGSLPFYEFADIGDFALPRECVLVGVELMDESIELPSFRHPHAAAYIMGPERGSLSPAVLARCAHVVRIPTRFSINLSLAGALVMYDRLISQGRFAPRPVATGGPTEALQRHAFAPPKIRRPKPSAAGTASAAGKVSAAGKLSAAETD